MEEKAALGEEEEGHPLGKWGGRGDWDENSMGYWDSQEKYQEEQHTPAPIVTEEGSEPGGYCLTAADHMIRSLYGEHLHQNDVTHIDGGMSNNAVW